MNKKREYTLQIELSSTAIISLVFQSRYRKNYRNQKDDRWETIISKGIFIVGLHNDSNIVHNAVHYCSRHSIVGILTRLRAGH